MPHPHHGQKLDELHCLGHVLQAAINTRCIMGMILFPAATPHSLMQENLVQTSALTSRGSSIIALP